MPHESPKKSKLRVAAQVWLSTSLILLAFSCVALMGYAATAGSNRGDVFLVVVWFIFLVPSFVFSFGAGVGVAVKIIKGYY